MLQLWFSSSPLRLHSLCMIVSVHVDPLLDFEQLPAMIERRVLNFPSLGGCQHWGRKNRLRAETIEVSLAMQFFVLYI